MQQFFVFSLFFVYKESDKGKEGEEGGERVLMKVASVNGENSLTNGRVSEQGN